MAVEGRRAAPFCRALDGGRYLVDVTGPFLAKFGGVLSPDIAMVVAIMDMDEDGPQLLAALGPRAGAGGKSPAWNAGALEAFAGVIGATAWPGQACGEAGAGELEVAAAEIVAGLSVEHVEAQLAHVVAARGEKRGGSGWKRTRGSGT